MLQGTVKTRFNDLQVTMNGRIDDTNSRIDDLNNRVTGLDGRIDDVNDRMSGVENGMREMRNAAHRGAQNGSAGQRKLASPPSRPRPANQAASKPVATDERAAAVLGPGSSTVMPKVA